MIMEILALVHSQMCKLGLSSLVQLLYGSEWCEQTHPPKLLPVKIVINLHFTKITFIHENTILFSAYDL